LFSWADASEQFAFAPVVSSSGMPRAGVARGGVSGALNAGLAWILGGGWIGGIDRICFCGFLESVL